MRIDSVLHSIGLGLVLGGPAAAQILTPQPAPAGNPSTPEKVLLGKALFWDEQMSTSRTVACGTCHIPSAGGADPRGDEAIHPGLDGIVGTDDDVHGTHGVIARSADGHYEPDELFGIRPQITPRAALSPINAAFQSRLFWDGRANDILLDPDTGSTVLGDRAALEVQALDPPLSEVEMGHAGIDWGDVVDRLTDVRPLGLASDVPTPLADWIGDRDYPELFAEVFASPGLTPTRIAMAIAAYERTLISDQSPADYFFQEIDPDALTPLEEEGAFVYLLDGGCVSCHRPSFIGLGAFMDTGVRPIAEDAGRGGVTGLLGQMGSFRVPDLHNVGLRPNHFHNGGMASLADVVEFYDRGGDFRPESSILGPLDLTDEQKAALVVFLETALIDPRVEQELPPFDRPTLYAESPDVPATFGFGTHGTFGFVPELVAVEPPVLGNDQLTIGLHGGTAGQPAYLLLGVAPGPGQFDGLSLFVDPGALLGVVDLGVLAGTTWGDGTASTTLDVPMDPSLDGLDLFTQGLVPDFGAPTGLAATAGAHLRLFAPR